jgi:hypothetical protein
MSVIESQAQLGKVSRKYAGTRSCWVNPASRFASVGGMACTARSPRTGAEVVSASHCMVSERVVVGQLYSESPSRLPRVRKSTPRHFRRT